VNLDDPDQFPNPETSGTGFFCFGLAWGINHGVLNRKEYLPAVEKAWAGLTQSLSPEGKVLWGQQVGDQPHLVTSESTHEYVTGTFLLSGSEIYTLAH
jgi:rhamnogalacturonyl hydrolase YesR